jgi:DNA-binding PadR family transcriptional regulator
MKYATLPASSYVVLGLLATWGPMTPYDLKKAIDGSIGYFWSFPRAQLYVEPERLKQFGLLSEERESEGRRRRVYSITPAGRAALRAWLTSDSGAPVQLHDPGLLKLFFAPNMTREDVVALARAQAATHRARLGEYERIAAGLGDNAQAAFAQATLRMGLRYEEQSVTFWEDIAANPPAVEPVEPVEP